jgi:ribosomal protein S12 methylthiotransferase accessory factor YcaO
MDVARGQKFTLPRLKPTIASVRLTLGTVPVSAGVERDGAMAAARTLIEMAAERRCAAALNGSQYF